MFLWRGAYTRQSKARHTPSRWSIFCLENQSCDRRKRRSTLERIVSSRLGKDQLSIHFTSLLDYLKSSKHYYPRTVFSGSNSSPEKSSPEKSSRFLSQKLVLRPALQYINYSTPKPQRTFKEVEGFQGWSLFAGHGL